MPSRQQRFYKTVRSDYTSVWAPAGLRRKYEIGKTYEFPPELPAHVWRSGFEDPADIYARRQEGIGGSRVLICVGNCRIQRVPCFSIVGTWNMSRVIDGTCRMGTVLTSTRFKVVGELAVVELAGTDNYGRSRCRATNLDKLHQWMERNRLKRSKNKRGK